MGTSAPVVLAVAVLLAAAPAAVADTRCVGRDAGGGFATCFDLGNRLYVDAGSEGVGGALALRQQLRFDDEPDLTWKLEHELLASQVGTDYRVVAYRGRFLRHARDGHLVLPFAVGRKIFLPFDIGAEAEAGRFEGTAASDTVEIGVVRAAALVDLGRTASFRRRLAIGSEVSWDVTMNRDPAQVVDHVVAPFSRGVIDARAESASGLAAAELRLAAGASWSQIDGWQPDLAGALTVERIVIAVNDRPLSVRFAGSYRGRTGDTRAEIGVRFALFQRQDRRVVRDVAIE